MKLPFNKTKVEALKFSGFGKKLQIDILRDDLIHPLISGNKWRKLKYIIENIAKDKSQTLVTFGGAYSNHLVATAFAGNLFGIKTFGFVRGEEKREANAFEKICIENGMTLKHVGRNEFKDKYLLFDQYKKQNPKAYFVGEGGRHPLALLGCAEIITDLNKEYDYIFLSLGTGTTMEGIVAACVSNKLKTKVIGISSLKNNFELDEIMSQFPEKNWLIDHNYHRGKYAKNDIELSSFIKDFHSETNIQLEFVYTGKMMMALQDYIHKGFFKIEDKILCIHTGGLPQFLQ
jgi:1-aminocyclopropane-1-carboxylate deaminase